MPPEEYLSTDPQAGTAAPTTTYLSTDPTAGTPPATGSAAARAGAGFAKSWNPVTIATGLYEAVKSPEAVGRTLETLTAAAGTQFEKAREFYRQGDYEKAAAYTVAGLLPAIGPAMTGFGERIREGDDAAGALGEAAGLLSQIALPSVITKALPAGSTLPIVPKLARAAVDPVGEAVAWGLRQNIPVDVATATGNTFLRGTQRLAEESLLGSPIGRKARDAQAAALTATGSQLAERTAPGLATTPELAGEAVRGGVRRTVQAHAATADEAYGQLRTAEENLLHADYVPEDLPTAVKERMRKELGGELPTAAEVQELRRIYEELDAVPFQQGRQITDDVTGERGGLYAGRQPGAPVYHDILQEAPGTADLTRADVQRSIALALRTGRLTNAARGALAVAKKRLSEGGGRYEGLSSPILPPDAGMPLVGMKLPVDLRPAKAALQPLYNRLRRERDLTNVLHGTKARALVALDTLMTAGDHAPLSIVDAALGDLKTLARADVPELRTAGQGAAAQAVKHLDAQVRNAATAAGPEVLRALETGRAATRAKYVAGKILEELHQEGVGVFRKATSAKDAAAGFLRDLQREAPAALPQVGRAFLEELLHKATAEGGFSRAQGLFADWQKLGAETKQLLFRDAAHIKDLDNFFLLAKKLAENPNPSGTALTAFKGAEGSALMSGVGLKYTLAAPVVAKLLLSPKTTRLLLNGLRLPVNAKAARLAWAGQLERALQQAGPSPLVPAVTEDPEPAAVR